MHRLQAAELIEINSAFGKRLLQSCSAMLQRESSDLTQIKATIREQGIMDHLT